MSWNVLTYVRMQREDPIIPRRSFLASPDTDRWLPIFDRYEASQAVNAREGRLRSAQPYAAFLLPLQRCFSDLRFFGLELNVEDT